MAIKMERINVRRVLTVNALLLIIVMCFAGEANKVYVRPPAIKMTLISALDEIYLANELVSEKWKKFYNNGDDERYQWLISAYEDFTDEQKAMLGKIFEQTSAGRIINTLNRLPDDAGIEEITKKITFSFSIPLFIRGDLNNLLRDFYKNTFREYYEQKLPEYEALAVRLTNESDDLPNPFDYIEIWSGINLGDYECVFYYTFRKIGAWGFTSGNRKISTIQATVDSIEKLYAAPLHEYAHNFFQTFTKGKDFKELSEKVKQYEPLLSGWEDNANIKKTYDWRAFCEENLVEGFAKFLRFKLDQNYTPDKGIYPLDMAFYDYLREMDFTPQDYTLKEIAFMFYEELCVTEASVPEFQSYHIWPLFLKALRVKCMK